MRAGRARRRGTSGGEFRASFRSLACPGLSREVVIGCRRCVRRRLARRREFLASRRRPSLSSVSFSAGCRAESLASDAVSSREFQDRLARRARRAGVDAVARISAQSSRSITGCSATWNQKINLTGLDLAEHAGGAGPAAHRAARGGEASPARSTRMIDIGSGGGSPAFRSRSRCPALQLLMVEAKTRKSVFLREALRALEMAEGRSRDVSVRGASDEAGPSRSARTAHDPGGSGRGLRADEPPGVRQARGRALPVPTASGAGSPGALTPPLSWRATYPLLESQGKPPGRAGKASRSRGCESFHVEQRIA